MMRFWIDTEYNDSGDQIELISLGAVAEDGREFYAISTEFDPGLVDPWVRENILPHLDDRDAPTWKSLKEIASEFVAFVGDQPAEFWSLIATYDWYVVTRTFFGGLDRLPSNWPFECWDLYQWAYQLGEATVYPKLQPPFAEAGTAHHALEDARRHRQIYEYLVERARDSGPLEP